VSDGGVHSHINHIKAISDIIEAQGVKKAYIHAFTDGRDCDPFSGLGFLKDLQQYLKGKPVKIATIVGRYYAMDRDKRWERVKRAYDLLVNGIGTPITNIQKAVKASYDAKITDEFLEPMFLANKAGEPIAIVKADDVVICFNFRTDRLRELTQVLSQVDMPEHGMTSMPLHYTTITRYDDTFKGVHVMFENDDVSQTLGEVIEKVGKTQLRIAETEKYPHVTYFFSGGRELSFVGEERIMRASPKVATYDLQPEMSAPELTMDVMENIKTAAPDFICMNFANTDMVGHTGVFSAAMKAAETVDNCLSQIVPLALQNHYQIIIIADHGNSDYMINEDGSPNTAHTMNPVPCILVSDKLKGQVSLHTGRLADVAPTLLALLDVPQPAVMTGKNLINTLKPGK
jgi:2,3-bisphosphoglycerate-independent phosphoglycerate mutase